MLLDVSIQIQKPLLHFYVFSLGSLRSPREKTPEVRAASPLETAMQ